MRLIDRVLGLEPDGGRYGLGRIRAEADIHPDDWFLTCHFVDDMVMPGTLMYECCAHTLRVMVQRMGWIVDRPELRYEPVQGVKATLKCRGPVTPATRQVVYEVDLKELGYRPEPYVIADANMYADGHPIVRFTDMSLQLTGAARRTSEAFWRRAAPRAARRRAAGSGVFTRDHLEEFAIGKPSAVFGRPYAPFDSGRFIARLPAPPYLCVDRIRARAPALGGQTRRVDRGGVRCAAGRLVHRRRAHRRRALLHPARGGAAAVRLAGGLHGLGAEKRKPPAFPEPRRTRPSSTGSSGRHRHPAYARAPDAASEVPDMIIEHFDFEIHGRKGWSTTVPPISGSSPRPPWNARRASARTRPTRFHGRKTRSSSPPDATVPPVSPGRYAPPGGLMLPARALSMIDRIELLPERGPRGLGRCAASRRSTRRSGSSRLILPGPGVPRVARARVLPAAPEGRPRTLGRHLGITPLCTANRPQPPLDLPRPDPAHQPRVTVAAVTEVLESPHPRSRGRPPPGGRAFHLSHGGVRHSAGAGHPPDVDVRAASGMGIQRWGQSSGFRIKPKRQANALAHTPPRHLNTLTPEHPTHNTKHETPNTKHDVSLKYSRVCIESFGYELPSHVVTSEDLERRLAPMYEALRIQRGQLEAITGIRERRYWDPGFPLHQGAARAGRKALDAAGIDARGHRHADLRRRVPRQPRAGHGLRRRRRAGSAARRAGLRRLQRLPRRAERHGQRRQRHRARPDPGRAGGRLRVRPGDRRPHDRTAPAQTRHGRAAQDRRDPDRRLGRRRRAADRRLVRAPAANACSAGWPAAPPNTTGCAGGGRTPASPAARATWLETDSTQVLQHGVALGIETFHEFRRALALAADQPDKVICHQVGATHQRTILEAIGIPAERDFTTFRFLGNIGTVSLPITAAIADERGFLGPATWSAFSASAAA